MWCMPCNVENHGYCANSHTRPVSVCVVGMVICKIYFDVKANIDCDICYFGIVTRILELIVIKFDFWQSGLEDVLKEVPKGSGLEGVLEEVPEGVSV